MSLNIDPQEVNKFDKLAREWWDLNGSLKTLHGINPLRLAFIKEHVNLAGAKAIDVGCGGGILTESLAQAGAIVTGIDMSEEAIKVAQLHWADSALAKTRSTAVSYQVASAETMAEQTPDQYDVVTCMELLEHVPDPASVITACAKLAKPGGHIFFSTINRNPKAYLYAILGAEYILRLLPTGTHDYAKFIKPSELASWARHTNLIVHDFKGMHYNPFTQHYSVNDDISVNYLVHCQR